MTKKLGSMSSYGLDNSICGCKRVPRGDHGATFKEELNYLTDELKVK